MGRRRGRDYIRNLSQREDYVRLVKAVKSGRRKDAGIQADLLLGLIAGHNRILRKHVDRAIRRVLKPERIIYVRRQEAYAEIGRGQINQIYKYLPELSDYI